MALKRKGSLKAKLLPTINPTTIQHKTMAVITDIIVEDIITVVTMEVGTMADTMEVGTMADTMEVGTTVVVVMEEGEEVTEVEEEVMEGEEEVIESTCLKILK